MGACHAFSSARLETSIEPELGGHRKSILKTQVVHVSSFSCLTFLILMSARADYDVVHLTGFFEESSKTVIHKASPGLP